MPLYKRLAIAFGILAGVCLHGSQLMSFILINVNDDAWRFILTFIQQFLSTSFIVFLVLCIVFIVKQRRNNNLQAAQNNNQHVNSNNMNAGFPSGANAQNTYRNDSTAPQQPPVQPVNPSIPEVAEIPPVASTPDPVDNNPVNNDSFQLPEDNN